MKKLILLACLAVGLASCSNEECGVSAPEETKYEPIELTVAEQIAAESMSSFGFDFFNHVCERNAEGNIVVSPLSVSLNLSVLANASDASFQAEFSELMGCSDIDALNSLGGKLTEGLTSLDGKAKLALANSLWYPTHYNLNSSFAEVVDNYYGLETFCRNLGSEMTRDELNRWASDNTGGLIDRLEFDMNDNVEFVLANALYFKAPWAGIKFDADNTDRGVFHGAKEDVSVDMMHGVSKLPYVKGSNYRAIEIPFGNGAFRSTFVLPDEGYSVEDLAGEFENILVEERNIYLCKLSLPRIKLDMDKMLNVTNELSDMGLNSLGRGGFTFFEQPLTNANPLQVLQKTSIEFNEGGAEAASVTVIDLVYSSQVNETEISFDRPYAFFIRESGSNLLLFAGRVSELR